MTTGATSCCSHKKGLDESQKAFFNLKNTNCCACTALHKFSPHEYMIHHLKVKTVTETFQPP